MSWKRIGRKEARVLGREGCRKAKNSLPLPKIETFIDFVVSRDPAFLKCIAATSHKLLCYWRFRSRDLNRMRYTNSNNNRATSAHAQSELYSPSSFSTAAFHGLLTPFSTTDTAFSDAHPPGDIALGNNSGSK